ncbi:MAG: DUF3833 domain-containing protein [Mangrovicoccus sp.]|nr:DUF3833 domain-containing protein [Mangrovicoccus sp.]
MEYLLIFLTGVASAILVWIAIGRFWSFTAQTPEDYAATGPDFDIRAHLNGPMLCEGVIYGPLGRVNARFVAEMEAKWQGDTGIMTEDFRYDSGTTQHREWQLKVDETGQISATAPDILGEGKGQQKGAGVRLGYRIRLPEASGGHVLSTVDWMYLMENGTIINRSQFRKFGIRVAELVATMRPLPAQHDAQTPLAAE